MQILEAHDVVAAVDVDDFAGDGAGEVAGEEEGCAADFELVDVAVEGGALGVGAHHVAEVADAAGGEGFDGSGGDGVDADVFGAELPGEVADGGLEGGLGEGHDVVVGDDLLRGVEAEGHDAAALGHEGRGGAGDGDERVDADVHGDAEAFAAGVEEVATEIVWRERRRRRGRGCRFCRTSP